MWRTGGWLTALLMSNPCVGTIRKELWQHRERLDRLVSVMSDMRGPSLVLKKGCLHQARLWYTPLAEVNQAILAWSFRQLWRETARGPAPPGNEIHFNQVKSGVTASQYPVTGGLCAKGRSNAIAAWWSRRLSSVLQRACLGRSQELQCFTFRWMGTGRTDCHQSSRLVCHCPWGWQQVTWQSVSWAKLKSL